MTVLERTAPAARGGTFSPPRLPKRPPAQPAAPRRDSPWLAVALAALTLASASGLARVFLGAGWVAPVVLSVLGVHLVAWLTRRAGFNALNAGLTSALAVVMLPVWLVLGGTTFFGLPLASTWHEVGRLIGQVGAELRGASAPTHLTPAFSLLAALGTAAAAALADSALFWRRSALEAAVPGCALFVVCSVLATPGGRAWSVGLEVAALGALALVNRATAAPAQASWLGGRSSGVATWAVGAGALTALLAVAAAVAVVPLLPQREGSGFLGWSSAAGAGSTRQVVSPVVELPTRLQDEPDTNVFTVSSSVPSYWRLTSLDTFTGQQWQATDSYQQVSQHLPGVSAPAAGARLVNESFAIQDLNSVWLPVAFYPESVKGAGQVSYDPVSGSLLTAHATSDGLRYQVTSDEELATLNADSLAAVPALAPGNYSANYLQLPGGLPDPLVALSKQITAGQTTEYGKALALQNFFYGPTFTYSLNPPTDGYGLQALETFLFETRTGYCQQFAGAYAVLARLAGLPTRLAVGFTTGQGTGPTSYQVTDADAHTWPEVWFPTVGWVPFEPTKGGGFQIPGAEGYTGNTAAQGGGAQSSSQSPTTVPSNTLPGPSPTTVPVSSPKKTATSHPAAPAHYGVWVGLALIILVPAAWLGLVAGSRRSRWSRRRRRAPPALVALVLWEEVGELLAWRGVSRRRAETFSELAGRARHDPALAVVPPSSFDALDRLAGLAGQAAFGTAAPDPVALGAAAREAAELRRALTATATFGARVRYLTDPVLAWRAPAAAPRNSALVGAAPPPAADVLA